MSKERTGKHPLAYLGVEPTTPPQMVLYTRDPTVDDNNEFNIGTIWVVADRDRIWMLMDLSNGVADWVLIHPSGAANTFNADIGTAISVGGVLNMFGGTNITTSGVGNTVTVSLSDNVAIPGTLTLSAIGEGFVRSDATGLFSTLADGTDGQVLIGATAGDPAWANLTSSDSTVVITTGHNTIDLRSVGGGGGTLDTLDTDVGSATPTLGVITIAGGTNINTAGAGSTVTVNLDDTISVAGSITAGTGITATAGDITATAGAVEANTSVTAGNGLEVTAGTVTFGALGAGVVFSDAAGVISSSNGTNGQVIIGGGTDPVWASITSGDASITITPGANTLDLTVTGAAGYVTGLDTDAGATTPTAGVIDIAGGTNINTAGAGSTVTVNLDDTISVAGSITAGTGITATTGDITATAGAIDANTSVTAGNGLEVTAGTVTFGALGAGVVQSSAAGVISSSNGTNGQVIIGGGAAPAWATLTSGDASITYAPGANTLDITVTGGGGGGALDQLDGDTGTAVPVLGAVTIAGGTNVTTTGAVNTLTVDLDNSITLSGTLTVPALTGTVYADATGLFSASQGTDLQFYIGSTGTIPDWLTPVSEDASMTIAAGTAPGTINFQAVGAGGGDVVTLSDDASATATPDVAGDVQIAGGLNINTSAVGKVVTVNLDLSIYQPNSNASGSEGVYYLNSNRFLHNYTSGTGSTFIGEDAGKLNVSVTGSYNTGVGYRSLQGITSAGYNTALGANSLIHLTTGTYNIGLGYNAGSSYTGGESSNIVIGNTGTVSESNVLRIGTHGSGAGQQNRCYIAGIMDGGWLGNSAEPVFVDQYSHVSTDGSSSDGELLIGSTANGMSRANLTSADGSITIVNGPNTINLQLPHRESFLAYQQANVANVTGDGSLYYLGRSSVMVEYFDVGNNFYGGNGAGAECYYTAPVTGKYYFTVTVLVTNLVAPAPPVATYVDPLNIVTTKRTYQLINPVLQFLGAQTVFFSALADMDLGDTAKFSFGAFISGIGKTLGIGLNSTKVGGYLVSRG